MEMQYAYKESSSSSSSIERRGGGGISAVGIVSLVLAVLALMVGAMNYVFLTKILAETKKMHQIQKMMKKFPLRASNNLFENKYSFLFGMDVQWFK